LCSRRQDLVDYCLAMTTMRKGLLGTACVVAVAALAVFVAYIGNVVPPVPAVSAEEMARGDKPFVVKLHAQWCPVCLMTKDVWSRIATAYAGRVHLVVFDVTTDTKAQASRAEAARLGLTTFFDEWADATGTIVVLNGRTRDVTAVINGSRDFAEYRDAIDSALNHVRVQ
jgi:thiol-disulfide isomerase/thioredoxin